MAAAVVASFSQVVKNILAPIHPQAVAVDSEGMTPSPHYVHSVDQKPLAEAIKDTYGQLADVLLTKAERKRIFRILNHEEISTAAQGTSPAQRVSPIRTINVVEDTAP